TPTPGPSLLSLHDALPILLAVAGIVAAGAGASAETLRIVNNGGSVGDAQREAFIKPFADKTGVQIVEDTFAQELAKIRSQVETRSEEHTSELQSRENLVCR